MRSLQLLVIDDEPAIRQVVAAQLRKAGHTVDQAGDAETAMERLSRGDIDIVLSDIKLPNMSGIDLLRQARLAGIDTAFIMMTAYASVDTAIEAIKAGAADYMIKPLNHEELLHRLTKVGDLRGLRAENRVLRRLVLGTNQEVFGFNSPTMREMEHMAAKVARTNSTVLVTGESGTGKGVVARLIHQQSPRADGPFIPVNCGAIPENLVESEFFGHTRGSITCKSFTCRESGNSPISSKKIVPVSASKNNPFLALSAPVNEPRVWPKNSLSTKFSGIAPQLTGMKGQSARGLC